MSYNIDITVQGAVDTIDRHEQALDRVTESGEQAKATMGKFAAGAKDGAEALRQVTAEAQASANNVTRLKGFIDEMNAATGRTKAETEGASRAGKEWVDGLEREAKILERIRAPMREYNADMDSLERMMAKGTITASEYREEMDRLIKKQGTMQGPKQDLSAPASQASAPPPPANLGTNIVATYAAGQMIMGGAQLFAGVIQGLHDMEDESIKATNAAQKFVDVGHDVNTVMREQLSVAEGMHASYGTTIALYNKVREGSEGVALSHREQLQLTQTLGEAVQLSNKPVEEAASLMSRFGFAMQTGVFQARELRSMMREVPAITEIWRDKFHATNAELMDMMKVGKLTMADLVGALAGNSEAMDKMHAKFANLSRTNAQVMSEYKEHLALINGNDGTSHLEGMLNAAAPWLKAASDTAGTVGKAIEDFVTAIDDARAAAERLNQANLHGVAQEIEKLNDPADKARLELDALNKAFGTGGVTVDQYNKELLKLQTTINHGIAPEGLKINIPIDDAKKSLDSLNKAFADSDITWAQYEKRRNELSTTIAGTLPEAFKLTTPIDEAKRALADLNVAIKQGGISSEAARIEADKLLTTINDGRLPAAIKLWEEHEGMTGALRDARDAFAGLDALFRTGRVDASEYVNWMDELNGQFRKSISLEEEYTAAMIKQHAIRAGLIGPKSYGGIQVDLTVDQYQAPQSELANRAAASARVSAGVQSTYAGMQQGQLPAMTADVIAANKALNDAFAIAEKLAEPMTTYEQALKDITAAQSENLITQEQAVNLQHQAKKAYEDAIDALDPVAKLIHDVTQAEKNYADGHRVLDAALARTAGITLQQYNEQLDKQRAAYLANSEAGKAFLGGLEAGWIKLKSEAGQLGATLAGQLLGDVDKLNAGFVDMINGTTVDWSKMVDGMIIDLERLLLKQLEVAAVNDLMSAVSSGSSSGGSIAAAAGGAADIAASARTAPGAYPMPTSSSTSAVTQQATPAVHIQIVNRLDDSVVHAAMDSPQGQRIVLNTLRANQSAVRSYSGLPVR